MDVGKLPDAMSSLRRLTTPLHLLSPCVWQCVRPTAAAWRPGSACHLLSIRTRCQATAVEEQTAVSQPQTSARINGAVQAPAYSADAPTFQEAIARLQGYWSQYGCAICQPHNTEVMAGTRRNMSDPLPEACSDIILCQVP